MISFGGDGCGRRSEGEGRATDRARAGAEEKEARRPSEGGVVKR